jgi:hypothetical protein
MIPTTFGLKAYSTRIVVPYGTTRARRSNLDPPFGFVPYSILPCAN